CVPGLAPTPSRFWDGGYRAVETEVRPPARTGRARSTEAVSSGRLHQSAIGFRIVDIGKNPRIVYIDIFRLRNVAMHHFAGLLMGSERQKFVQQRPRGEDGMAAAVAAARDHEERLGVAGQKRLRDAIYGAGFYGGAIHWDKQEAIGIDRLGGLANERH